MEGRDQRFPMNTIPVYDEETGPGCGSGDSKRGSGNVLEPNEFPQISGTDEFVGVNGGVDW